MSIPHRITDVNYEKGIGLCSFCGAVDVGFSSYIKKDGRYTGKKGRAPDAPLRQMPL